MPASSSDNGSDSGDGDVDTSEVDTDELSSEEGGENDDAARNGFLLRRNSGTIKLIRISHRTYQITLALAYHISISRMRNPSTERRTLLH